MPMMLRTHGLTTKRANTAAVINAFFPIIMKKKISASEKFKKKKRKILLTF